MNLLKIDQRKEIAQKKKSLDAAAAACLRLNAIYSKKFRSRNAELCIQLKADNKATGKVNNNWPQIRPK